MLYEKKIGYLEYRENGEKVRSAGFVKIEVKNDCCNLQVQVDRFPALDNLTRKILIQSDKKEGYLGEVVLGKNKGSFRLRGENAQDLGQSGIPYCELAKILIVISKGRELVCCWRKETEMEDKPREEPPQRPPQREELQAAEEEKGSADAPAGAPKESEKEEKGPADAPVGAPKESEKKENASAEALQAAELHLRDNAANVDETMKRSDPDKRIARYPGRLRLHEDKWKQLASIYPHITPFQDEREYLSITPADFVVLQKQYYRLVSNSFLLHGFYSYDHLILTRMERAGAVRYYVGVPGSFYEKERQIAIMFGFESFECKKEPVAQGDFGYYCIRVDL